jgi:hypothetical protein
MNTQKFVRYTFENVGSEEFPEVNAYGWGTYESYSVLAGQPKKVFLDSFTSIEAAVKEFPEAQGGSKFTDPIVSLNHLPDENDFVDGGVYPDDI